MQKRKGNTSSLYTILHLTLAVGYFVVKHYVKRYYIKLKG